MLLFMLRRYVSFLVIISLVLAGISPACRFISGKTLFEICGFGEAAAVAPIDDALLAYLPDRMPEGEHKSAKGDCAFCFAQTHLKLMKATGGGFPAVTAGFSLLPPDSGAFLIAYEFLSFAPRGPPVFILL